MCHGGSPRAVGGGEGYGGGEYRINREKGSTVKRQRRITYVGPLCTLANINPKVVHFLANTYRTVPGNT